MNKRKFFKLISGMVGSCALPVLALPTPEFKPFSDLYDKIYLDYFYAVSVLMSAEIDKEMIISMLKILSVSSQYTDEESLRKIKDNIKRLEKLNFEIESYKTGYRIVAN